jgi:hypothetical protein
MRETRILVFASFNTENLRSIGVQKGHTTHGICLFSGAEWQEILRAFDRFLETTEELLEIFAAFNEVDIGRVDHKQV